MDYGNFDELPVSSLVAMTNEFIELPVQAVHCRLAGTLYSIKKKKNIFYFWREFTAGPKRKLHLCCRKEVEVAVFIQVLGVYGSKL